MISPVMGAMCLVTVFAQTSLSISSASNARVETMELENGMVWLVVERPGAPIFSGIVRVRVGGADEAVGETGLVHLLEHLAFKGTPLLGTRDWPGEERILQRLVPAHAALSALERAGLQTSPQALRLREEVDQLEASQRTLTDEDALLALYRRNGATQLKATTDKDLTSFSASFPKNRLELWLTVEAQRLAAPVFRGFSKERLIVEEERRRRIESSPGGTAYNALMALAFVSSPYRWPTSGIEGDVKTMSLAGAQAFWRAHFTASNAVGCIVGDVDVAEVRSLLRKTFGQLPTRPRPPEPTFSEPASRQQRRSNIEFAAQSRFLMGFRKETWPSTEDAALRALEVILGEGNSSRLVQRLVVRDRLAQSVDVFSGPGARFQNLFIVSVLPLAGASIHAIEAAIWDELHRLAEEPLTAAEVARLNAHAVAEVARANQTNEGLASMLSLAQVMTGDWRTAVESPRRIEALEPSQMMSFARSVLTPENSAVVVVSPRRGGRK